MIAKGNLHGQGGKLARYLMTSELGEDVEFVEARGLDGFGADPVAAFEALQDIARHHMQAKKPFFHSQTRIAPGEELTREQWMEVADREEKRLGFEGQPRIITFHIHENGERHMHIGWSRIDLEEMRAIDPGLFKNHLNQIARDFEKKFELRELSNARQPEDRAKAPGRGEEEESRRLNTDVRKIRTAILDCLEHADGGRGFRAALAERGLTLANGDRRDGFVVIDEAGGQHALNKKLTGLTLAAMRERMSDLDRSELPSVEQAKQLQVERQPKPELQQEAKPEKPEHKLGRTAGDIRTAWQAGGTANELEEALAARGISIAEVSAEEAKASERRAAFAREVGNALRVLKEAEIVAVDGHGHVYHFDRRTTGDTAPEIKDRLDGIDQASLMSVADTKEVMREAARESRKDEQREAREEARPANSIETTIAELLIDTITGKELAEKLDDAGLTIARADQRDEPALDALRQDAKFDALAAYENIDPVHSSRLDHVMPGDIAAVTRYGNVILLSPDKLDLGDLEQRLAEVEPRGLSSIVEARAQSEIDREDTAKHWADIRTENAEARQAANEAFEGDRAFKRHVNAAEHGVEETIYAAEDAVDAGMHAATHGLGGLAKAVEKVLSGVFSFFGLGEPKLTPAQREQAAKAEDELSEAHAQQAAEQKNEAARDWEIFEKDRRRQQDEHEENLGYRSGDRERERERD
jgi:hypothetical protein